MRKNLSTIILILIFLVGLSVMLYPSVSDAVNRKHQSLAVAGYAEEVEQLSDADYQTYFDAADAYNRQLNTTPNARAGDVERLRIAADQIRFIKGIGGGVQLPVVRIGSIEIGLIIRI